MKPSIKLSIFHFLIIQAFGFGLGFMALGTGFSDNESAKSVITAGGILWSILNAPASIAWPYLNSGFFGSILLLVVQIFTSMTWGFGAYWLYGTIKRSDSDA